MVKKVLGLFIWQTFIAFCSHGQSVSDSLQRNMQISSKSIKLCETITPIYSLYPTDNSWVSIKLDTRNGKLWQVHFSVTKDAFEGILSINTYSLVSSDEEMAGRFTLVPTKNIYNFILLDQVNGRTYKVQWHNDNDKRFIREIY